MVVCVHSLVGKKNLLVQFGGGQKKEIGSSPLVFLSLKELVILRLDNLASLQIPIDRYL